MPRKYISQEEAARLRARVDELEDLQMMQFSEWVLPYPGGTYIATLALSDVDMAKVHTARRLGHPCVLTESGKSAVHVYAITQTAVKRG